MLRWTKSLTVDFVLLLRWVRLNGGLRPHIEVGSVRNGGLRPVIEVGSP